MLDERIQSVAEKISLPEDYDAIVGFMLECAELLRGRFSDVVDQAIELGNHSGTDADLSALAEARAAVWRELDGRRDALSLAEECSLRASLFLLAPTPPSHEVDVLLTWFVEYLADAGVSEEPLVAIADRHFRST